MVTKKFLVELECFHSFETVSRTVKVHVRVSNDVRCVSSCWSRAKKIAIGLLALGLTAIPLLMNGKLQS